MVRGRWWTWVAIELGRLCIKRRWGVWYGAVLTIALAHSILYSLYHWALRLMLLKGC